MFGYRDSIFKNTLKGKFMITRVSFRLSKSPVLNTGYGSLLDEAQKLGKLSIRTIREAVINIRKNKLPDPEVIGNAGSFFRNPVVSMADAEKIKHDFPFIPCYPDQSGGIKLAAGWLIEQCGWKGKRFGDAGVHEKQALVLVNYGKATGKEIFDLSEKIRLSVLEKFGIDLQREVEIVGRAGKV
jgi:UDP-N-acetylmuramate dehydrogenase